MLSEDINALKADIAGLSLNDKDQARLLARISQIEAQFALYEFGTPIYNPDSSYMTPEYPTRHPFYQKLTDHDKLSTGEIAGYLTALRSTDMLLSFVAIWTVERLGGYFASVMLTNESADTLMIAAINDPTYQYLMDQQYSIDVTELEGFQPAFIHRGICVIHSAHGTPALVDKVVAERSQTRLIIPLVSRIRLLGMIDVHLDYWRLFDKDEVAMLKDWAIQVSAALENARLFEAEHRQRKIGDTLREISLVIGTLDQEDMLELILEQIGRLIPYETAAVWLDDGNGQFHIESCIGYEKYGALGRITRTTLTTEQRLVHELCTTKRIISIPDVLADSRWQTYEGFEWIRSWIGVRLTLRGKVIGVLMLDHVQPGFYGSEHESLLETLVTQILIAIENAQLLREERRQREIANTLRDIGTVLTSTLNPQDVLERILVQVARVIPYDAAGIWLDNGDGYLRMAAGIGYEKFGVEDEVRKLSFLRNNDPYLGRLDTAKKAVTIPDFRTQMTKSSHRFEWIQSWAAALITVRGRIIGNIALDHTQPGFYGVQYEPTLEALATQVSIAITNARLFEDLNRTMNELKRSNEELQQFAYVASHDLQEPLRMITSYVQLLAKRYHGKLDSDADDFINFAVDGTHRMQRLINDLLTYSRVNTQTKPFEIVDCTLVVQQALRNLQIAIEENQAVVIYDPMPVVLGDPVQLTGVFQNLIANAIKFHGELPPQVHISAEHRSDQWLFSVRDNGIGIAPEYADRIFVIFKRLHTSTEYPGTGIGLSICKKVVERHGGKIWVESQVGKGATFYFYIPERSAHLYES